MDAFVIFEQQNITNMLSYQAFEYKQHYLAIAFMLILAVSARNSFSQEASTVRLAFYNIENFFDVFEDSTRTYNAFTPEGEQHWTYFRFKQKRNNLYKTLVALGEGDLPAVVGLCEVENEYVLNELIYKTPLKNGNYQVVHYESPDNRGIDVALLYRKDKLRLFHSEAIPLIDSLDPSFVTRDILFCGFLTATDSLYVYVNHWPSRYGGQVETIGKRKLAALTLRQHIDRLLLKQANAKIVIMGDFNDSPEDESVTKWLQALAPAFETDHSLIHLFTNPKELGFEGTLKYQHAWQIFDHIILSKPLFHAKQGLRYKAGSARIFTAPFLFEEDERHLGIKLHRTYSGPTYIGGFSDHLPIYIDLEESQ